MDLCSSSHVAAQRLSLQFQLLPEADHLPRRLIVRGYVMLYAPELTEIMAMNVLDWSRFVELLHPHPHANVFHFEQLSLKEASLVFA